MKLLKKLCAVTTAACFTMMIVSPNIFANVPENGYGQKAFDGTVASEIEKTPLNQNISDSIISSKYGKVVFSNNTGSDTVVINIQDLHCDYSVQKNIYGIIDELCDKYNIDAIYAEGGIGTADYGIFAQLNPSYKKAVLENLLKAGRLTGTEYYGILNDKRDFLKGVENEQFYKDNMVRLSEILKAKKNTEKSLSNINREIEFFKAKYLTSKNKKFNNLIDKYENRQISQKEFLTELFAFAAANNINTKNYKNLQNYFGLTLSSSDINKKALAKEFTSVISEIKENLSYDEYKKVMSFTSNFSDFSAVKIVIENYCNNRKINIAKVYPNVNKFLSLKKESLSLNPVEMIKEERKLVDTVRTYLSETPTELEIAYISDFQNFYKKFINAELTSAQWEYVKIGLTKFEELYAKYSVQNDVANLKIYSRLLNDFYNVNTQRNEIFLSNMGLLPSSNLPIIQSSEYPTSAVSQPSLFSAKKIMILVSGGYHTEGITELLNKNNISNITITPEVLNATASTRSVYENFVMQQVMSVRQMIALSLLTNRNVSSQEQLHAIMLSMFPNQALDKINVNMLAAHLNQIFGQNISFSVLPDGKSIEVSFEDGTTRIMDIPATAANAIADLGITELSSGQFRQMPESELKDWVSLLSKLSFNFGRDIFAPEIYKISKDICVFIVDNKMYIGNGAIYDIATSKYEGKTLDGVEPIIYEYMPDFMQNGLLAAQKNQDEKGKAKPSVKKIIKDVAKKALLFTISVALMLSVTACSVFDKNNKIEVNYSTEKILTTEEKKFNTQLSGYLESFYKGEGKSLSFLYGAMPSEYQESVSEPDKVTLQTIENLYDQALAAMAYMQIGDMKHAEKILSAINNDGHMYKSNLEQKQVTGEILWVGIAAVQYKLLTGSNNYDTLIQKVDDYLDIVYKEDGSYYGELVDSYTSTEHTLDAIAYLNLKTQYDSSPELKERLLKVSDYLYTELYNQDKGNFKRGYNDNNNVLDVEAWAVQVLLAFKEYNPEVYKNSKSAEINIMKVMEYAEKTFKMPISYGGKIYENLYRWSSEEDSPISFEWTMEMAVSYKMLGDTEKANAILQDVKDYSVALGYEDGLIPYSDQNSVYNYKSYGWKVFCVPALCTTIGQAVQIENSSFFFPLTKFSSIDYSSTIFDQEPLVVIENESGSWKSYALLKNKNNTFDLSNAESVTFRLRLEEYVEGARVRLQYLPKNPKGTQNFEGKNYASYWKNDFYFDENGELTFTLTMDEFRSCYASAEFRPELIDLEHVKIILNTGRTYFSEELNSKNLTVDVLGITIKYINTDEDAVDEFYEVTYDPSVPSSILPSTFTKINKLISNGAATTWNILKTILKEETLFSFLSPSEFVKAHPSDDKGARTLSEITILSQIMSLVLTVSVSIFFAFTGVGALFTALFSLGAFVVSMIAALFINVGTHAVMDFRFIKASGLERAIQTYGKDRVSFYEDGTLAIAPVRHSKVLLGNIFRRTIKPKSYTIRTDNSVISESVFGSVFVVNDIPANDNLYNFRPVPVRIKTEDGNATRCFIGKYNGSTVVLAEGATYREVVKTLTNTPYFKAMFGPAENYDIIAIDMDNKSRNFEYMDDGNIIIGMDNLKTSEVFDFRKEAALVAVKKVDAVTVNQNIAVFIDDSADIVSSPEDMASTVNSFVKSDGLGTSAKVLFSSSYIDKIISLLEQRLGSAELARTEFIKIIKRLKDDNKEISVVFDDVSAGTDLHKYFKYGIFTYIAEGTYFDSVSDTQAKVKMISDLNKIESFDGSLSVLRISQFKDEINETSGIFTFLNSAINIRKIMENRKLDFVKKSASNFAFDQIPEIPEEDIINIIKSVSENKFDMLSNYLDAHSQISVYYSTLKSNEKEVFIEEILKRILAVNHMKNNNIKNGFKDRSLELLLSEALYKSVINPSAEPVNTSALVARFATEVSSMSAAEADVALRNMLAGLTPLAFEKSDPEALSAIINLIPLYADKNIMPLDAENVEFINDKTLVGLRSVLAAA